MAALVVCGCTGLSGSLDERSVLETPSGNTPDLSLVSALPAPSGTQNGLAERLSENDLIKIDVFQVDELDRTVRVDTAGRINLALVGEIEAAGRTIPELEKAIEGAYGAKYLQNPEVSVFVEESAGQKITVDGAVNKPGVYTVSSTSTLLQVVAQAGGFSTIADDQKTYVFRDVGGRKLVANYNVRRIRTGNEPDPRIFGGDVIVSFSSGSKIAMRNLREALGVATSASTLAVLPL
ncbi:polysaccharide biosynthesis/export family protein [Oricola sp.]|uniref:polysaccharide biosynthesis/export family protein n=1 Tax=Oricola sp. TaxID=1979950 RepID=UPI003BACEEEE